MKTERLADDLFHLVGYLLSSAYGLYDEPPGYGPFRLLDAAGRLLAALEDAGSSDPFLSDLRKAIDRERFGPGDEQTLRAFLNQACLSYAAELKRRMSAG